MTALALLASLLWGGADFVAGTATKRLHPLAVTGADLLLPSSTARRLRFGHGAHTYASLCFSRMIVSTRANSRLAVRILAGFSS